MTDRQIMMTPYKRILVLHITIIIGGGLAQMLGSPLPALLVLIVGKTLLDLREHNRERVRFGGAGPAPARNLA